MSDPAPQRSATARPSVSVIVPFYGTRREGQETLAGLAQLTLGPDDELIVVDNTPMGAMAEEDAPERVTIARASAAASSYYARNAGARIARNDWLLFVDADCRPPATLIDDYFREPIPAGLGCVAGAVLPLPGPDHLTARYARYRVPDMQWMADAARKLLVTANALVRRDAWQSVGGFCEGIRSGGDVDFSWRVQDAGWELAYNGDAAVLHVPRETIRGLLRRHARYGAGRRWLAARHGNAGLRPSPARILRPIAGAVRWTITGKPERGLFRALDAALELATVAGYLTSNAPRTPAGATTLDVVIAVDTFPTSGSSVVGEAQALLGSGRRVKVEALRRSTAPDRESAPEIDVQFAEDDSILRRLADPAWLLARRPLRCVADAARHRGRGSIPLRALAPVVRRVSRSGATLLCAPPEGDAAVLAQRLAHLTGLPLAPVAEVAGAGARGE